MSPPHLARGRLRRRARTGVPKIVDWYIEGKINIDNLITHTMPLEQIDRGYGLMGAGKSVRSAVVSRGYCAAARDAAGRRQWRATVGPLMGQGIIGSGAFRWAFTETCCRDPETPLGPLLVLTALCAGTYRRKNHRRQRSDTRRWSSFG